MSAAVRSALQAHELWELLSPMERRVALCLADHGPMDAAAAAKVLGTSANSLGGLISRLFWAMPSIIVPVDVKSAPSRQKFTYDLHPLIRMRAASMVAP